MAGGMPLAFTQEDFLVLGGIWLLLLHLYHCVFAHNNPFCCQTQIKQSLQKVNHLFYFLKFGKKL